MKRIALLAAASLASIASFAGAADQPNVLFIAVDDLRPEIGSFGAAGMQTPNLDRLAGMGIRFERAYCMVPTCGASRAALMTSIRPARDRFVTHLTRASEDAPGKLPLHSLFKNNGYTTISLGKIFHHMDDHNDGWSEKPWRPNAAAYATQEAKKNQKSDPRGGTRGPAWEDAGDVPDDTFFDGQLAARAEAKLRDFAAKDQPFFLAVGFIRPHLPFVAPGRYYDRYPADSVELPDNYYPPEGAPPEAVHNSGELRAYFGIPAKGVLPKPMARDLIRGYYAATSYTDAQIGRLLDAYDDLGLKENTIIVLWGDHGWNLGEHTMWCKHSCFETSMRAPLIFAGPDALGIKAGAASQSLAEFIDIYPTLCDLAALPKPDHLQGQSLAPILRDPSKSGKGYAIGRFGNGDTIRDDRYRFSIYRDKKGKEIGRMLYDHQSDPGENKNVAHAPEYADAAARLAALLEKKMGR